MKVITVATHPERYYESLLDSAKKNNIELVVLGMGEKWKGFVWRFDLILDFLKKIKEDEIILFIDAYDVIFLDNISNIEQKFLEIKKKNNFKILMGNDLVPNNFLNNYTYKKVYTNNNPQRINAGIYMGYVKDILEILTYMKNNNITNNTNDQILFIEEYNRNPSIFYFDKKHEIIVNAVGTLLTNNIDLEKMDFEFIKSKDNKTILHNKKYNTYPMVLHGPGNANLDDIILKYNYKLTSKNKDSKFNHNINLIKTYYMYFKMEILILIIILCIISYFIYKRYRKKSYHILYQK